MKNKKEDLKESLEKLGIFDTSWLDKTIGSYQHVGTLFDTEIVNFIIKKYDEGKALPLKESPFYKLTMDLRRANLNYNYTKEEIITIHKATRVFYLSKNYEINFTPESERCKINFLDYQEELIQSMVDNKFISINQSRQMGISTCQAYYILFYILHNQNKNIYLLDNRKMESMELIDKIKYMYRGLPFFLKPGIINWNKTSICFDNGCKVIIMNLSNNEISIGCNIDLLMINDFDLFMTKELFDIIINSVSTNNKSKLFIFSTGKLNEYHKEIHFKDNEWIKHNFPYTLIKSRDQKWIEKEIKMIGKEFFEKEYELNFSSTINNKK